MLIITIGISVIIAFSSNSKLTATDKCPTVVALIRSTIGNLNSIFTSLLSELTMIIQAKALILLLTSVSTYNVTLSVFWNYFNFSILGWNGLLIWFWPISYILSTLIIHFSFINLIQTISTYSTSTNSISF